MRTEVCSILLVMLTVVGAAGAQDRPEPPYDLDEAVLLVKQRTGGRVLRAESVRRQGRQMHEVRIMTSRGEVRTVRVDPQRGIIR